MTRKHALPLPLVFAIMLLPACRDPDPKPAATECEAGFILDGSVCIPESCGMGKWGILAVDDDTVYVDGLAGDGGDGTEEAPYATIQRGLNRAGALGGGLVAVAAGTYLETLEFTTDHADVHLAGRCREMAILDASAGDEEMPGIYADLGYTNAAISGLSVVRSPSVGILVASGSLRIENSRSGSNADIGIGASNLSFGSTTIDLVSSLVDGNSVAGILAQDAGTEIHISQSEILGTLPGSNGLSGHGIEVIDGAVLSADSCTISANASEGLFLGHIGADVTITDSLISDTQPDDSGTGSGIAVDAGAHLRMENCAIERNFGLGIDGTGEGTLIDLRDTIVRDTRPDPETGAGFGIQLKEGADIVASGCLVEGNTGAGVLLFDPGTQGTLRSVSIQGTLAPSPEDIGIGIQVSNGAELRMSNGILSENSGVGINVGEPGSRALIEDTVVRDTILTNGMGDGVDVTEGANLVMDFCDLDGNARNGIMANDPGTVATIRNSIIHGTQPDENGQGGGILVTTGASLVADGCLIERNIEGMSVEDVSTTVVLRRSIIRDSVFAPDGSDGYGIQIIDQAWLLLEDSLVEGSAGVGLLVDDPGTRVSMVDSTVRGTLTDAEGLSGVGIQVSGGASLHMERSLVEENRSCGVSTLDPGTEATIVDSTIRATLFDANDDFGFGLDVTLGSHVMMEGSVVEANLSYGARAVDPGTEFLLVDTIIRDNGEFGLDVYAGASLSTDGCLVEGNVYAGVMTAESGTRVSLRNTIVSDTRSDAGGHDGFGLSVQAGASLTVEDCLVESSALLGLLAKDAGTSIVLRNTIIRGEGMAARGIEVQDGAQLSVEGCAVEAASQIGLLAAGLDAMVVLTDSLITGTTLGAQMMDSAAIGLNVQEGAVIDATRIYVTSNQGLGLLANGTGSRFSCSDCTISDNQFAGAAAIRGGTLEIADSVIEGTKPALNLLGGAGIYAWHWAGDPPTVTVTRSAIRDNPVAGVWLLEDGAYRIVGNTISGGEGEPFGTGIRGGDAIFARDGITAWDGTSGLLVQDNELIDASGAGVFLLDSAALLDGNGYEANGMDLVVQGDGCEAPLDGYIEATRHEFCPQYDYPTCYAEFFFVAMPAEPTDWDPDKAARPAPHATRAPATRHPPA